MRQGLTNTAIPSPPGWSACDAKGRLGRRRRSVHAGAARAGISGARNARV